MMVLNEFNFSHKAFLSIKERVKNMAYSKPLVRKVEKAIIEAIKDSPDTNLSPDQITTLAEKLCRLHFIPQFSKKQILDFIHSEK